MDSILILLYFQALLQRSPYYLSGDRVAATRLIANHHHSGSNWLFIANPSFYEDPPQETSIEQQEIDVHGTIEVYNERFPGQLSKFWFYKKLHASSSLTDSSSERTYDFSEVEPIGHRNTFMPFPVRDICFYTRIAVASVRTVILLYSTLFAEMNPPNSVPTSNKDVTSFRP